MSPAMLLLVVFGVVGCLWFITWRAKHQLTLFVLRVERGRIIAVKGRMPQRLLDDIADVMTRENPRDLRIVCRLGDGRACLEAYGDSNSGLEQVLRNLIGEYPLLRLKQASRARRP